MTNGSRSRLARWIAVLIPILVGCNYDVPLADDPDADGTDAGTVDAIAPGAEPDSASCDNGNGNPPNDSGAVTPDGGVMVGVDAAVCGIGNTPCCNGQCFDPDTACLPSYDGGDSCQFIIESGAPDAAFVDAGLPDAAFVDAGLPDAAFIEAGLPDAAFIDAGLPDAAFIDAGLPDAAFIDAGLPDADFVDSAASTTISFAAN